MCFFYFLFLHACMCVMGEHPCVFYVCVRLVKQWWVIHRPALPVTMGHTQQVPHLPMWYFFFFFLNHLSSLSSSSSSSYSSISSSSFSSLTHSSLPHHHQWHHRPLPNTLLWWIILYVEIFSPPVFSQPAGANLNVTHSFIKSDSSRWSIYLWLVYRDC